MQALIERRIPFLPAERIERLQQLRLRAIIHHAYNTVPFYHQAMDDRNLLPADFRTVEDLAQLPLIDGVTVRENLDSFVSSAVPERSRLALYTSGSQSQIRRMVYWDRTSLLNRLAIAERDRMVVYRLMGFSGARKRLYILPPESLSIILRSYWEENTLLHRDLVPRQMMPIDAPYETVVERINEIRPHIVYSYGSYAEAFFRFLHNHKLEISLPWVWMYGGDMLSPVGRELIENTFNCPVYSAYGAVETGRLGFECERRNGYHLNVDLCAARIVDENGETADPELAGDVVISNLHNKAMVLLNYRLGDRAVMAGTQCPCGRSLPLLERLEG
ncbi:MAG: phenylacetate--CoA ligase family protein, partial [Anaerolineales bacterium]|nr:phenylacetate--CoA ligase family protein [Anaerolineales bacterium]